MFSVFNHIFVQIYILNHIHKIRYTYTHMCWYVTLCVCV